MYSTCQSYKSDTKARGVDFESVNSIFKIRRASSGNSIIGATATTTYTSISRSGSHKLKPNKWIEYIDSLKNSLVEAKEYMASIRSKAKTDQASLLHKLEQAMDQNTKLLALLTSGATRKKEHPLQNIPMIRTATEEADASSASAKTNL